MKTEIIRPLEQFIIIGVDKYEIYTKEETVIMSEIVDCGIEISNKNIKFSTPYFIPKLYDMYKNNVIIEKIVEYKDVVDICTKRKFTLTNTYDDKYTISEIYTIPIEDQKINYVVKMSPAVK